MCKLEVDENYQDNNSTKTYEANDENEEQMQKLVTRLMTWPTKIYSY